VTIVMVCERIGPRTARWRALVFGVMPACLGLNDRILGLIWWLIKFQSELVGPRSDSPFLNPRSEEKREMAILQQQTDYIFSLNY